MPRQSRFGLVYALLASVVLLQSCVVPSRNPGRAPSAAVRIAKLLYLSYGPHFIGVDEGYFEEQGLEVEFVKVPDTTGAIPLLIRGELDVYSGVITLSILNAIGRGAGIKIVAGKAYLDPDGCATHAVVAGRLLLLSGALDDPARLRGRRISINRQSVEGYYVERLLRASGLTLEDLEIVASPPSVDVEALATGAIDLTAIAEPWVTLLLDSGHGVVWKSAHQVIPDFQWSYVVYGPTLLGRDEDTGRRFMIAYLKAVRQFNQGATSRNVEILARHTGLSTALLRKACWPVLREDGRINVQSVMDFQAWALAKGMLDGKIEADRFWEPRFVAQANQYLRLDSR